MTNDVFEFRALKIGIAGQLSVAVLLGVDITLDLLGYDNAVHVAIEILAAALLLLLVGWLGWQLVRTQRDLSGLVVDYRQMEQQAQVWRAEAEGLSAGMRQAIAAQFAEWGFSEAESDIAWKMLQGLGFKQIARDRNVSERTVRQQAGSLYRKAGLQSRSELPAVFFRNLA